ncbi:minichromosome maintenance protein 7 [Guillardia theta CCMP2712]|uniref:DNA replication licensing factor MCM7 n=1 Tax=Guillardia theta (strain CCMP2712) TaxID=905079 RepID=L1JGX3_GUITC|nr:minichromosome maintenance protein 7 [Guillardia theta CCMP2712]EKX47330.1 minichromosome maintenance protein 7 [Guillardia theta CCMP2712]|eukprot:XP_005834310.1 minichromosome maintenance protein 7 [Guillardia theta CCMP2712]
MWKDLRAPAVKLKKFIEEFEQNGELKYMQQLQKVANRSRRVVEISLDDLEDMDEDLSSSLRMNTRRYLSLLGQAIDQCMPEPDGQRMQVRNGQEEAQRAQETEIPLELKRRYEIRLLPGSKDKFMSLRTVKANHIGQLVSIRAMVARCSDVKPLAKVVTYTCEECGWEAYQEVTGRSFYPLDKCKSPQCQQFNSNSKLLMQTRGSKFVKFQEIKIQELPDQVPTGHIPRMMTVHLTGESTRSCSPGDEVQISGIFLPIPYTGYRAIKAGLTADTFLEATSVSRIKQRYQDYEFTQEMQDQILLHSQESGTYTKLANSIAPEIFGHEDVKKTLLLQLVSGCHRNLADGLQIRGDVHVCLMGDPGVAKSQLLKHVAKLTPRGVYTTGKGSSGVGLTASVTKDAFTGELMLEGGALVIADQGICCIDEFDKMEETDRTSVLAAANPAYGRYNPRRSPSENINLPPALLSRFDILFLLMDKINADTDFNLARHVCHVHRFAAAPQVDLDEVFDSQFLRAYIAQARSVDPYIPAELSEYITGAYVSMRTDEEQSDSRRYFFTTARTLLSILRLSQGLARLRFSKEVEQADIDEAIRLMYESKKSLYEEVEGGHRAYDPISTIFDMAKNLALAAGEGNSIRVADLESRAVMKGFTRSQLLDCIKSYEELNVWQTEANGSLIRFVDVGDA